MNKVFNRLQTLKSSEDCKKFSKSVSYETLVGGTATIGRDIKQTRRLIKGCADKPLSAVGTLTSLLCNFAKVMEKWLQISPVVRLLKVLSLWVVLSISMVGESRAACNLTNDDGDIVDESGNYCGTCGTDCHWVLDGDGNMKITGSGKMADYHPTCVDGRNPKCTTEDRPWQKYREQIKNVDIQGVTTVGNGAFYHIPITNLTLGNSITTLKWDAFEDHNVKILELPDSLTTIETQALDSNLRTLIVPDTLTTIATSSITRGGTLNIICRGNNCDKVKNLLKNYKYTAAGGTLYDQDLSVNFSLADSSNCDTENFYWSGENCARKDENGNIFCATGYAEYKNKCWDELPFAKKRWTPAEANEWLHDGNDNFVVITFKK